MAKTLLILAAGNGSRYGALKQFDELGPKNEFIFEYSIYDAIRYGFKQIVIITKEENVQDIDRYFKKRLPSNIKVDVIAQKIEDLPIGSKGKLHYRVKPWGTAHAVWVARKLIKGSFAVLNADDFYGSNAFTKASLFMQKNPNKNRFALIAYALKETLSDFGDVSRGICKIDNNENLSNVDEIIKIQKVGNTILNLQNNSKFSGEELVSMNFWICNSIIFEEIERKFIEFLGNEKNIRNNELYLPKVIQSLLEDDLIKVKLIKSNSKWFGITYAKDKIKVKKELMQLTKEKRYPSPLWKN